MEKKPYSHVAVDDDAGLDVRHDLEELGHVERDGEDDDEELQGESIPCKLGDIAL